MSVDLTLLKSTDTRALGFCIYGPSGLRKTLGIHTLPPPILMIDFEGGTSSLMPWIARRRNWNSKEWTSFTQEDRVNYLSRVPPAVQSLSAIRIQPGPLIDVVWFDPMDVASYDYLVQVVAEIDTKYYSTVAVDSLQEFSADIQTFSKGAGKQHLTMTDTGAWGPAQERAAILLRRLRSLREKGIFQYFTCSEQIDKDYVVDPRNQKQGAREEPFSIKGTANVPGKLTSQLQHFCDIMMHARFMGPNPVWVAKAEPIGGSGASWEAKDRTGRLTEDYNPPNIRLILDQIYGEETRRKIYARPGA